MTKYWDDAYQRGKRAVSNVLKVDGGSLPKYKVLQIDMMKPAEREAAATVASFVSTGDEAYKLSGHNGFAYQDLDVRRRVGVVKKNGIEIALLFHRLVIEREPLPEDPIPERVLSRPSDEWMFIPLTNTDNVGQVKGQNSAIRQQMDETMRYKNLYMSSERQRLEAEQELVTRRNQLQELSALKEKSGLQAQQIKATEQELERVKSELKREKLARQEDKVNMVRQLMPAFTTAWLAGLHRVGDQLYGMLKKQIIDGLKGIGVEMVAPEKGDDFDPALHHAIHSYPFPEGDPLIGKVVQTNQIGWRLSKGQVLEAAMVGVGVESQEEKKNDERNGSDTNAGGISGSPESNGPAVEVSVTTASSGVQANGEGPAAPGHPADASVSVRGGE